MAERVLVTGSAGVVGSHVLRQLLTSSEIEDLIGVDPVGRHPYVPEYDGSVPVYPFDVRDQASLLRVLRSHRPDVVLHLGAALGSWHDGNPLLSFEVNLAASCLLYEACAVSGVRRVVLASSRAVYEGLPHGDRYPTEARTAPQRPYGMAKLAAESAGRQFAARGDFEFAAVRFADFLCVERSHKGSSRAADVLQKIVVAGVYGEAIRVRVAADRICDPMYGPDLGRLVAALLTKKGRLDHHAYNIGAGTPGITLASFVDVCRERHGSGLYDLADFDAAGTRDRVLDCDRVEREFGNIVKDLRAFLPCLEADIAAARSSGFLPPHAGSWLEQDHVIELVTPGNRSHG